MKVGTLDAGRDGSVNSHADLRDPAVEFFSNSLMSCIVGRPAVVAD